MKRHEITELMRQAAEMHNSQDMATRRRMAVSSAASQITTLQVEKKKIMDSARAQCREIDEWIDNCARSIRDDLRALDGGKEVQ